MKNQTGVTYFLLSGLILSFILSGISGFSQGTRLLRQPTLSKDQIAFVYADDLWIVSKKGGTARRLTTHEGSESVPHFSPDGKWLAFSAQYAGNTDVYVIPAEGGEPRRLTWHPGEDLVQGWSPDGKSVLFRSGAAGTPTRINQFYYIAREGGWPIDLGIPQASFGEISADGKFAAFTPITFWDPEWRNYRGGQAMPIWIVDLSTMKLEQTPQGNKERHTDPVWFGEKVFFLSERDDANNVWSYDRKTKQVSQHTFHKDFDVKSIDAGPDALVYEQAGYLHLLEPGTGKSDQLIIQITGDFSWSMSRWESIKPEWWSNASLSPTGQRVIFEYRGEIFTVPKEKGSWRNITNTSGVADRFPAWSSDGQQLAWFSDQSGEYQLTISDQFGVIKKRVQMNASSFYFQPYWSPDNKYISFTDKDYSLYIYEPEKDQLKKIDTDLYANPERSLQPVWSPDSKWIAYSRRLPNQLRSVFLYEIATGVTRAITDPLADAIDPVWDEGGEWLFFLASTDFGTSSGWLDMTSYDKPVSRAIYAVVLSAMGKSPLLPQSDDEKSLKDTTDKVKKSTLVQIDFKGIQERTIPLTAIKKTYQHLFPGVSGSILFTESIENSPLSNVSRFIFNGRKTEALVSGVNSIAISLNRKQLLYQSGSTWGILKSDVSGKSGDGKINTNLGMKVDPISEWHQIFREGWRFQRDFLYVDNVHGAPWSKIYEWYHPWVDHVRHRTDLNYVVDILGGEVSVGHSYTSGGDFPLLNNQETGLLGVDYAWTGTGFRIKKIYNGEQWNPDLAAPLAIPGIGVKEGDFLLEINGQKVDIENNPHKLLIGTVGRLTQIRFNSVPDFQGSTMAEVIPVSNESSLRLREWVEENRRRVDRLSGGKLAYVYVPNTGQPGYTYFNRYYFGQQDKKGAVIDERNNGGGSAADYMVEVMNRPLMGYFNNRVEGHRVSTTPMTGIFGPKVMIINERAGSGGDLLPYMFRKASIGPLIGTRTWGGLVGTWDTPRFIDGGRMVAPRGGFFDTDGQWAVEGEGIAPDIEVLQDPAAVFSGKDPQLERAVQEALKLLETKEVKFKAEPAPPVRWRRPKGFR